MNQRPHKFQPSHPFEPEDRDLGMGAYDMLAFVVIAFIVFLLLRGIGAI